MKSTKLVATLLLLFVTSAIFAQKVHYKDRYYTIVKSKIFHRGYDVYGKLSPGKIDTIHIIAKELYTERGKLKEKYKKRKKRDRYKLPETFWEQREVAVAQAVNNPKNKTTETTIQVSKPENNTPVLEETALKETTVSTKEKSATQQGQDQKAISPKKEKEVGKEKEADRDNDAKVIMKEEADQKKKEIEEKSARKEEKKAEMKEKIQQQKQNKKDAITEHKNEKITHTQEKREKALAQKEKKQQKIANQQDEDERNAEKATKKAKNKEAQTYKDTKNKAEESSDKEKRKRKKLADNIEQQQSKEAKNLKKKEKSLKKTDRSQLKKQKALDTKAAALAAASAVTIASSKNDETFGTIYLKINKEKTSTTQKGAVLLFFDVINNSSKDLVILKPNNSINNRLDFFSNTMECEDIPVIATDYLPKELKIKDGDYLTIPANAKIELFINGEYRNWLACNSENVILQIQYNPFKNAEESSELEPSLKKELNKSLKRITPIKIESENIKFKLNKPE